MDYRIIWLKEALEDLNSIAEYIARDSIFYSNAVVTRIIEVSDELYTFPESGRVVPEINNVQIRERIIYSYRLIYRIKGSLITVLAVRHGKRLFTATDERYSEK